MTILYVVTGVILVLSLLGLYMNMLARAEIRRSKMELFQYLQQGFSETRNETAARLSEQNMQMEQRMEYMRNTVETRLASMQSDNNRRLSEMRETVDERLQKTLDERLGQSFRLVSDSLEQVYKGLGEMQTLASGVGDLKKVLSNIKTRGILGEIQLGAILEQILSPEQYVENFTVKDGSRVEFALKLPGDESGPVYLPIDAKFPADAYNRLVDAYDSGDAVLIDSARKNLEHAIKGAARSICEKYIDPPLTTDFAIMFLPAEGLYAEVVRLGLVESLQSLFKVNIAGPTTIAAILNSLQMGFKTLAIQKRSGETWRTLAAVKTEFARFENVLIKTQKRLGQAGSELDTLIGVRTRMIMNKLKDVTELPEFERAEILPDSEANVVRGETETLP